MAGPNFLTLNTLYQNCFSKTSFQSECISRYEPELDKLLAELSLYPQDDYDSLKREEKLSFWLNSYMAWLSFVLSELPDDTVSLEGFREPLEEYRLVILGEALSLREIQEKIWTSFRDERILFVLPDGTRTGPGFSPKIFTSSVVEDDLKQGVLTFVRDPKNVVFKGKKLWLNPLLSEKASYFLLNYGNKEIGKKGRYSVEELAVLNFLYRSAEIAEIQTAFETKSYKIQYFPVDLTLRRT
jgi:hypothetical protein